MRDAWIAAVSSGSTRPVYFSAHEFRALFPVPHDSSALPVGSKVVYSVDCEYEGQDRQGKERILEDLFVAFQLRDRICSEWQLRFQMRRHIPMPVAPGTLLEEISCSGLKTRLTRRSRWLPKKSFQQVETGRDRSSRLDSGKQSSGKPRVANQT